MRPAAPLGRAPARTLWDARGREIRRAAPLGRAPARTLWDARGKEVSEGACCSLGSCSGTYPLGRAAQEMLFFHFASALWQAIPNVVVAVVFGSILILIESQNCPYTHSRLLTIPGAPRARRPCRHEGLARIFYVVYMQIRRAR